jgi:cation diffusion facilitator family transporter
MAKFPDPVELPDSVLRLRRERKKQVLRAAICGVVIRLFIVACEFAGVAVFGSAALLMDALSSLVDVISSSVLILFIKLAARPPDAEHPFGHGRYEPLAGLQLGLLLVVLGLGMTIQQTVQMTTAPERAVMDSRAWLIPFAAVILLELSYRIMIRVAKKQHSPALAADAIHFRIDALTSLLAAISLICSAYAPVWSSAIDHIGAILIAIFMVIMGVLAMRNNARQLMDRVPPLRYFEKVRRAAKHVAGVLETEKIRIQLYGPDAHVDIDVEVEPTLTVDKAHRISQKVRVAIQKEWPAVRDVIVHIEPYYPHDH